MKLHFYTIARQGTNAIKMSRIKLDWYTIYILQLFGYEFILSIKSACLHKWQPYSYTISHKREHCRKCNAYQVRSSGTPMFETALNKAREQYE